MVMAKEQEQALSAAEEATLKSLARQEGAARGAAGMIQRNQMSTLAKIANWQTKLSSEKRLRIGELLNVNFNSPSSYRRYVLAQAVLELCNPASEVEVQSGLIGGQTPDKWRKTVYSFVTNVRGTGNIDLFKAKTEAEAFAFAEKNLAADKEAFATTPEGAAAKEKTKERATARRRSVQTVDDAVADALAVMDRTDLTQEHKEALRRAANAFSV